MKIRELIKKLEGLNPELEVVVPDEFSGTYAKNVSVRLARLVEDEDGDLATPSEYDERRGRTALLIE